MVCHFSLFKERGYATVLTLILFTALGLSLLAVFNSGQIVTHKLKLQNAVDAASYSSVVVAAREMNYIAYTNRAMVVNQVTIGQVVGLVSWTRMMKQASSNIDKMVSPLSAIPVIGALIKAYFSGFEVVSNTAEKAVMSMASIQVPVINFANIALSESQYLVHQSTAASILELYQNVLKDNDPDVVMGAIAAPFFLKFQNDIENFSKRADRPIPSSEALSQYDKFAKVITGSIDSFTDKRSYRWIKFPTVPTIIRAWVDKKGGNEFDRRLKGGKYIWDWSAMDTVSLWTQSWSWKRMKWKSPKETVPLGGGAAHSSIISGKYPYSNSKNKWGGARENTIASYMAESNYKKIGKTTLRPFYFMNDNSKNPTPPEFIAVASKEAGSVRTWKKVIEDSGGKVGSSFDIEEKGSLRSSKMYAMAKAEVYFSRSHDLIGFKRQDGSYENGNYMNPYWQVRMKDLDSKERTAILMLLPK